MLPTSADQKDFSTARGHSFRVVGLEVRTSNERERAGNGAIGKLWARVLGEKLLEDLDGRDGSEVIALYTNYETNKDGPYTYLLGAKVRENTQAAAGMTERKIPPGDYAVFTGRGDPKTLAIQLWQRVWQLEAAHSIQRSYHADYEIHHLITATDEHVDLYIGMKR